jgi:hypothetical protein
MRLFWQPAVLQRPFRNRLVESYFLKLNEPAGRWALWLKYTFLRTVTARERGHCGRGVNPDVRPPTGAAQGHCWAIFFDRENGPSVSGTRTEFRPWQWDVDSEAGVVLLGDNRLAPGACTGSLEDGRFAWDLRFSQGANAISPVPGVTLSSRSPTYKLTTPYPQSDASGTVTVGDHTYTFAGFPLSVGHNWGYRHTPGYAWAQACSLDPQVPFYFEGFSLPVSTRYITMGAMRWKGQTVRFTNPLYVPRARTTVEPHRWDFRVSDKQWTLDGQFQLPAGLVAALPYAQPTGEVLSCTNSMLADASFDLHDRASGDTHHIEVPGTAALEFLVPTHDHGHPVID